MILYVPLIPTCEPLLIFFWIRPCASLGLNFEAFHKWAKYYARRKKH